MAAEQARARRPAWLIAAVVGLLVIALATPIGPGGGLPAVMRSLTDQPVVGPQTFRAAQDGTPELVQAEAEPADQQGDNDDVGELLAGVSTSEDDVDVAVVTGTFAPPAPLTDVAPPATTEDDGALDVATPVGLSADEQTTVEGRIGDGPHGSAGTRRGDVDMYEVQVPAGMLLRARLLTPDGSPLQGVLSVYDEASSVVASDSDGGAGYAAVVRHRPSYDQRITIAVGASTSPRPLDPFDSSSGLGVGGEGLYRVELALIDDDLDRYTVEAVRGEVVAATLTSGAGRQVQLVDLEGIQQASTGRDSSDDYPAGSPIAGGGPHAAVVVPFGPVFDVAVAGRPGPYELRIHVRRTGMADAPAGSVQGFHLDTDGAVIDARPFGGPDGAALDGLAAFMAAFGLTPGDQPAVEEAAVSAFAGAMEEAGVQPSGVAVSTDRTTLPPLTTSTIVLGGSISQLGASLIAAAPAVDVGNTALAETGVVLLDTLSGPAAATGSLNGISTADRAGLVGEAIGRLAARVAAEMLGARQTSGANGEPHLMDPAADVRSLVGVGPDGVWGTGDDAPAQVYGDVLDHTRRMTGNQPTDAVLATSLVPGTDDRDDPPVVAGDTFTLPPGGLQVDAPGVLANDRDPEGLPLTASLVDPPASGVLELAADGGFTFTPAEAERPEDATFTYTVTDGTTTADPITATLTVCGGTTIANGSFESGDLKGWCVDEGDALFRPRVVRAGQSLPGLGEPDPSDGDHAVITGFESRGADTTVTLFQILDLPADAGEASLSVSWRTRWDLSGCQGCAPRTLTAAFTPLPDTSPTARIAGPSAELLRAEAGTTQPFQADSGALTADVSSLAGQRVRAALTLDLGDPLSGPAQLELDDVAVTITPAPDDGGGDGGGGDDGGGDDGTGGGDDGTGGGDDPVVVPPEDQPEPQTTPTPEPTVDPAGEPIERLAGSSREETAVEVSRAQYPADDSAGAVVLARRDDFADGLAGAPFAASIDAPLLLTGRDALHPATATELERVLADGGQVFILGGTAAIGDAVVAELVSRGFDVERVSGPTRFQTAIAIAQRMGTAGPYFLVTGGNFPDALSAGPAAIQTGGAILLTAGRAAHPDTQAFLATRGAADRFAVGGQSATAHPEAEAIVGSGREATAVAVATRFFDAPGVVGVARSDAFADALSGGALMGRRGGPMLLTSAGSLHPATEAYLRGGAASIDAAVLFGGRSALGQVVATAVQDAIG